MTLEYLTLPLLLLGAVQAGPEGESVAPHQERMLSSEALDELRGTAPEDRAAYLGAVGLTRADWYPRFERAPDVVLAHTRGSTRPPLESLADLHDGMLLVSLLRESEASPTLKRILQTPGIATGESITCLALIALSDLGTDDAFLVERIGDPDPRMSRLAILAVALRSDESIVAALKRVRETRESEAPIGEAFQFVGLMHYAIDRYAERESPSERLTIVGQQVARGFNPINGITLHGDPFRASGPATRWAFERWRELASQYPEQFLEFIRNESPYETTDLNASYRRYLGRHGGAQILARLGDGK